MKKNIIRMAIEPTDQNMILSQMVKLLLKDRGEDLEIIEVEGGTKNIQPAMLTGQFDLYSETTGTAWTYVLKNTSFYSDRKLEYLKKAYEDMGLQWMGMTGTSCSWSVALRADIAEKYNIKTISDLKKIEDTLVFGAPGTYLEKEDGLPVLTNDYGLTFKDTKILPENLLYSSLKSGKIDLMPIMTTDGRLAAGKMIALEDDLDAFPDSSIGFVINPVSLQKWPVLREVLDSLEMSISATDMKELNTIVSDQKTDPADAAKQFLIKKELLSKNE